MTHRKAEQEETVTGGHPLREGPWETPLDHRTRRARHEEWGRTIPGGGMKGVRGCFNAERAVLGGDWAILSNHSGRGGVLNV